MNKLLKKYWPILVLTIIVGIIGIINYVPGTFLTGWDNLHPEFNLWLNIQRSFFSVWQEYQGLGLLGGHAHSSDILRQLSLLLLSYVLPESALRYLSTIFMLLTGAIGAYAFIKFILSHTYQKTKYYNHDQQPIITLTSFLGALFYLLNLATMQTFYAPFEAFTMHYAALPWLLFTGLSYVASPNPKTRLWLILSLLFALPAAYIPTLFLVYGMALGLCLLVYLLAHRTRKTFGAILKLGMYIFLVNAFWLLPFVYFTMNNATVNVNSKINQMATETIFLQNKEFGTIPDVMLLKGFWFNNTDPDRDGRFTYMLLPWRDHLQNPFIASIGYGFFLLVFIGFLIALKKRQPYMRMAAVLLLFSFIVLAVSTPPFSWINALFRESIPLLNQAFRFPFTKFSILAGLTYAMLISIALYSLFTWLKYRKSNVEGSKRLKVVHSVLSSTLYRLPGSAMPYLLSVLVAVSLMLFSLPIFTGHLYYNKERIALPKEYQELFAFFNTQSHTTRIANLPQHTFWGWNFYDWGYGGSGFLWYGLPQPILDRAFDVWSSTSENYYYELSQAIYRKDPDALAMVLAKYDISWLLLDESIIYPPSPKALFYDELKQLIASVPGVTVEKRFGDITVYKVVGVQNTAGFVYTTGTLPDVNSTPWLSDDTIYASVGSYMTSASPSHIAPFRTLATVKSAAQNAIQVSETPSELVLHTEISIPKGSKLSVPAYAESERVVPVRIRSVRVDDTTVIEGVITPPFLRVDNTNIGVNSAIRRLFVIADDVTYPLALKINGADSIAIKEKTGTIITTMLSLTEPNLISLTPKNGTPRQILIRAEELSELPILMDPLEAQLASNIKQISLVYPKITDPAFSETVPVEDFKEVANCDAFRNGSVETQVITSEAAKQLQFMSDNATACTSYFAESLPHDMGYILQVTGKNERGRPLHFWVENIDQRRGPIDTYLPADKTVRTNTFFLPSLEQFGRSYAFHFDNIAIGAEEPINILQSLSYYPYPYAYATKIQFDNTPLPKQKNVLHTPLVLHPNESLYVVTPTQSAETTMILSQSYDPGWKAYQLAKGGRQSANMVEMAFPFFFGKELTQHVKVNNWANGWIIPNASTSTLSTTPILIVYMPQYLQYFGVFLSSSTCLFVIVIYILKKR